MHPHIEGTQHLRRGLSLRTNCPPGLPPRPAPETPTHPARLALMPDLIGKDSLMAGNNAGVKRNRRPRGLPVVRVEAALAPETEAKLHAARLASGQLSLSLYVERLVAALEAEHGALPVFSTPIVVPQEASTRAA